MMTNNDSSSCLSGHKNGTFPTDGRGTGIREEQIAAWIQLSKLGDKFNNCSDKLIWTLSN